MGVGSGGGEGEKGRGGGGSLEERMRRVGGSNSVHAG